MIPAEQLDLPAAAQEAGIDRLHLHRKVAGRLRARGVVAIGDMIDGQYLSHTAWDALGRQDGKAAWVVLQELASFCGDHGVDWPGFWTSRGVAIVPPQVVSPADAVALSRAVPALVKAALADAARPGADPDRAWVIIDGRNGLVSKPMTLEELGPGVFGLTRERVRQIETKATQQLAQALRDEFRGQSYRMNEVLDPMLRQVVDTCMAVDALVTEVELLAALSVPESARGAELRPLEFLLRLAGLVRFDADGSRRQAMWAPARDQTAKPTIELADKLGRFLTEDLTQAVSAADVVVALNRGARAGRVTLGEVVRAIPFSPLVEVLQDGRWQGRFEYLTHRGDQVDRVLDAADGPLELREIAREINARSHGKPVSVPNLSNQLAGDKRFVPIGKSGAWGLASRDAAAAITIPALMREVLHRAGRPMSLEEIDAEVRARRPAGAKSVAINLQLLSEFVCLPDKTWALATWPEALAAKALAKQRPPRLGRRVADVAIPYLKAAPKQEAPLKDVVAHTARELGVQADSIYGYFDRLPAFERVERDGRKFVRLASEEAAARAPMGRKSHLADRMAAVLIPYLESAPGRERELNEVVRYMTREMNTIPATVYGYLKRIPGVERIDEGDRKLVRLTRAAGASPARPGTPSALESRARDLIDRGETPIVEFKSTLMWSTKGNVRDPKLQKMVTKTMAAFANTRGGTLIIGVEPNGAVCGIELDCAILQRTDDTCVDAFSRSLATITAEHLGGAMAAHVATHFVEIGGRTVCVVDVEPGQEPAYLKADGLTEVFVRSGTTSVALPVHEIANYIRSRWS